jgi:3-oxoacyl-[acyl-carrier-protein] synthase II
VRSSLNGSVAITGCGWVTPFAAGSITEVLRAADPSPKRDGGVPPPDERHGHAGVDHATPEGGEAFQAVPDERVNDYPELSRELKADKGAWVAAAALIHACRDAAIELDALHAERVGLVLGCGLAGQLGMIQFASEVREQSPRFVSPIHFPQTVGNYIAGALARGFSIRGPNTTLAGGAASGLDAIVEGCALLLSGRADVVFAGGTECLSNALAAGLAEPNTALSEGASLYVLERFSDATARGGRALAIVTGWRHMDDPAAEFTKPGDTGRADSRDSMLVSVAGFRYPGAIFIEHWVGRCLGAAGSAALAAAIGAAAGCNVPVVDTSDASYVSIRRVAVDGGLPPAFGGEADGGLPAVVVADADGTHRTVLEIAIQTTRRGDVRRS